MLLSVVCVLLVSVGVSIGLMMRLICNGLGGVLSVLRKVLGVLGGSVWLVVMLSSSVLLCMLCDIVCWIMSLLFDGRLISIGLWFGFRLNSL